MKHIADTVQELRNMGFIVGLKYDGKVAIRYPGGNPPEEGKALIERLQKDRESTVDYLKVFMQDRQKEFRQAAVDVLEDKPFMEFSISKDKDMLKAVGKDMTLTVYRDNGQAREAQENNPNAVTTDVLADLWMAAIYEPQNLRMVMQMKNLFDGVIVG